MLLLGILCLTSQAFAQDSQSQLTVTPSEGPIGSVVKLTGKRCAPAGEPTTHLSFVGGTGGNDGTLGADDIPNISTNPAGEFETTYRIPSRLDTLQGEGGGAMKPGSYSFESSPPYCDARFMVTPGNSLPRTGLNKLVLLVLALVLLVVGQAWLARSRKVLAR